MEVQGPDFKGYDKQHLQVTRRLTPEVIKPNIFRGLSNEASVALLMTDLILLSPEAEKLLKKLKEKWNQSDENMEDMMSDEEFISNLHQLKKMVAKKKKPDQQGEKVNYIHQYVAPIDEEKEKHKDKEPVKKSMGYSPLRESINNMIVHTPGDEVKNKLIKEAEALGESIILACKQFGVRIIILKINQSITDIRIADMQVVGAGERTSDGRPWKAVRGLYDQSRRIIVIGEEQIGRKSSSTIRHELAHAFDHTFTTKNQRKLPLSVQLWNLFHHERKELVSDYAGTNPAEYFAESVEEYFNIGGSDRLKEKDPLMYEYLEKLFSI
ncbi:MAG: zinc-dependent peptidase [Armatimonadota bacterium]